MCIDLDPPQSSRSTDRPGTVRDIQSDGDSQLDRELLDQVKAVHDKEQQKMNEKLTNKINITSKQICLPLNTP